MPIKVHAIQEIGYIFLLDFDTEEEAKNYLKGRCIDHDTSMSADPHMLNYPIVIHWDSAYYEMYEKVRLNETRAA